MSEVSSPAPRSRRALLIWAVSATLGAIFFANMTLLLWMRLREARATGDRSVVVKRETFAPARLNAPVVAAGTNSFEGLQDSDVVGRYRFFESGNEVGTIVLLPNHSMINKDGTTCRQYHWEIQPDGIMTTWQRNDLLFDVMEKPGVYIATKNGTEYRRIEKLPE